jgi:phosphonate transport system substrate-binding protein
MLKKLLLGAVALVALAGHVQAEDLKEFRVGIIGGENEADRLRNYQCLGDHLKAELGFEKVSLFPAADYDGVIQGLLGGTLDYAELGASGFAKIYLAKANAVEPILTTVSRPTARPATTRSWSRARTAASPSSKTSRARSSASPTRIRPRATSIPLVTLPEAIGGPVKEFFAETGFGGGHENLVLEVLKGTFDAGTTFGSGVGEWKDGYTSGNLHKMVEKGILDMNDIVELWKSPLIPNGPIVVRTSMADETKAKFKQFMLDLPKKDAACFSAVMGGDFTTFTEVNVDFYKPIIDARKATIGG